MNFKEYLNESKAIVLSSMDNFDFRKLNTSYIINGLKVLYVGYGGKKVHFKVSEEGDYIDLTGSIKDRVYENEKLTLDEATGRLIEISIPPNTVSKEKATKTLIAILNAKIGGLSAARSKKEYISIGKSAVELSAMGFYNGPVLETRKIIKKYLKK